MTAEDNYWPVYKGSSFEIWTPDTGEYYAYCSSRTLIDYLHQKRANANSVFDGFPRDWFERESTLPCHFPRIAFRNTARATDSRTLIAALVPPRIVIANQAPYLIWKRGERAQEALVLGILSTMILDWYVRHIAETNLNFFLFNSLPIPEADLEDPLVQRIVEIAGSLAAVDERYREWADEVGVEVGTLQEEPERTDAIHELDACVALLYCLDEDDVQLIFDTFHEGRDYSKRCEAVLKHFERWQEKT